MVEQMAKAIASLTLALDNNIITVNLPACSLLMPALRGKGVICQGSDIRLHICRMRHSETMRRSAEQRHFAGTT